MRKKNRVIYIILLIVIVFGGISFFKGTYFINLFSSNISGVKGGNGDISKFIKAKSSSLNDSGDNTVSGQVVDKALNNKEVFLTIDDGPSDHTLKILSILDENNVKATFFVIGKMVEANPDMLKAIKNDGMSIENHSYSHDYNMYKSVETCQADFNKCNDVLKKVIGIEPTEFIRFPGGSDNGVSNNTVMSNIRKQFKSEGKYYIDWNVSSTDGSPTLIPTNTIIQTVTENAKYKKLAVVLMHDVNSKTTTVEALPTIIKYLKNQGFVFRTFDDITPSEINEMLIEKIADR